MTFPATAFADSLILFSQVDLRDLSRGFQSREHSWTMTVLFVILLVGIAVIVVWVWYVAHKREKVQHFDNHDHLFLELARVHALSRADRQLLRKFAQLLGLEHADLLFIRDDLFDRAYQLLGDESTEVAEQVAILKARLYSAPSDLLIDIEPAAEPATNWADRSKG